jgi:GT2 family glycosyltransferase
MTSNIRQRSAVAVIVLNWNGAAHLRLCLAALAAQIWHDFELIVVDNGSSDNSVAWLREQKVQAARVVALGENRGFAGGNAAGMPVVSAEAEFVVLLNNDTAPEPNWLAALVAAAQADIRRGAVASLMVDWSGESIDSAGDGIRVTGRGYQRFHGHRRNEAPASGPVFSACAGAALYRRAMLDEVGFLDERFFMNGEDTDFCFRARLAGWEVWYCAGAVVRHRVSASQVAGSAASVYFNERNRIWSVVKCMPAGLFWKYAWVHVLELPARGWFYLRRGRFSAWLRGVLAGVYGSGPFWRARCKIQAQRRVASREIERYFLYPRLMGGRDEPMLPRL